MPLSTINNISMPVNSSNFNSVFFKVACHANPRAERNFAGSNSKISKKNFLKF